MKKPKSYRFSPWVLAQLDELKTIKKYENFTETDILQAAINALWCKDVALAKPQPKDGDKNV